MNACVRGLMADPQHQPFCFTHCTVEIQFCAIFTNCSQHNTVALRHFIKCWAESLPIADSISGRVHSKGVLQTGFAPASEIACCIKGLVQGPAEEILLLSGSSSSKQAELNQTALSLRRSLQAHPASLIETEQRG